jgi:CheY-like chemotaxis protein
LPEVGILVIDDDIVSQRALKNVLDSEGWRVRIASQYSHAMNELASGQWNLIIVNIALTPLRGPLFAILRDLAQADSSLPENETGNGSGCVAGKGVRVLFVVPLVSAKEAQPVLEREGLAYTLKPYHLNDFLEKVSELLVEAGAIAEPIRVMSDPTKGKKRTTSRRAAKDARRGAMFASREDYQMTEEEMADFERQEEEERKKREKELKEREHL